MSGVTRVCVCVCACAFVFEEIGEARTSAPHGNSVAKQVWLRRDVIPVTSCAFAAASDYGASLRQFGEC